MRNLKFARHTFNKRSGGKPFHLCTGKVSVILGRVIIPLLKAGSIVTQRPGHCVCVQATRHILVWMLYICVRAYVEYKLFRACGDMLIALTEQVIKYVNWTNPAECPPAPLILTGHNSCSSSTNVRL